jgi:hypothetical protein
MKDRTMKRSIKLAIAIAAIAAVLLPAAAATAQTIQPLTRDQVRAELLQLESAGYNPLSNCTGDCPGSLRRAEAVLDQRRNSANAAYGPALEGTEQSGH